MSRSRPRIGDITTMTVLIADAVPAYREGLRLLLEREREVRVVGVAADGEQALRLAFDLIPQIILIDIELSKPGAIEVIRRIRPSAGRRSGANEMRIRVLHISAPVAIIRVAMCKAGPSHLVTSPALIRDPRVSRCASPS